jgi:CheY-like chemotaxis protein
LEYSGTESILVVDDEEILLEMAREILLVAGYQVDTASNGADALNMLKQKPYDLLFTDVIMPGMTGYRLVKEAAQVAPDTKVLLTSGYQVGHEQTDIDPELIAKVVQKPYGDKKLRKAVRDCLDGS